MILAGVACTGASEPLPQQLRQCTTPECGQRWVEAHVAEEPKRVAGAIGRVGDPVLQWAFVEVAHATSPEATPAICRALRGSSNAEACARLRDRAHLSVKPRSLADGDAALGPRRGVLLDLVRVEPLPNDRLDHVVVATDDCETTRCWTDRATAAARQGDAEAARASCRALPASKDADECAFLAAEALLEPTTGVGRAPDRLAPAVELCLSAASFQGQCLAHLTESLGGWVPGDRAMDAASWASIEAARMAGHDLLEGLRPGLGAAWNARVWTEVAWSMVAHLDEPAPMGIDGAPDGARPHLRGAMATLVVETVGDLDTLRVRVEDSVEAEPRGVARGARRPLHDPDYWTRDLPGEEVLPSLTFVGRARRTTSDDAVIDGLIVVLEAGARSDPPRHDLLAEGLQHSDPLVRWTAVRLQRCVDPDWDPAGLAQDADALVSQRATESCEVGGPAQMPRR